MTDGELVEASRRGELDAFGHLVARYQDVVCAVSYSSTGDRSLSEDVAQDTFVAAWRQLDRVREPGRLRPWLCGIARNLGRKARRKTRREEPIDADAHAAAGASPFDELARADAERIVRDALARVPDTYREVLVLYYRDSQSIRDVAETLGISEAAVMQRLSRGRRYLADSVTALVEKSLRGTRPRRDLVAAVLGAIAAIVLPSSRVDASPVKTKGSTMLKLALAGTALAAGVTTTVYLARGHNGDSPAPTAPAATAKTTPLLHYGSGPARAPALGPTAPARAVAARAKTVDDLALVPADSDFVLGIDVARIQRSGLWKQFVAPAVANAAHLQEFTSECGFDPIASLASVTVGIKHVGDGSPMTGAIVVHGFAKAKAIACITKMHDKMHDRHGEGAQITMDGDVVLIGHGSGPGAALMFIDDTTALVVLGPDATKEGVARIAAGDRGAGSPAYADLIREINTDDALWVAVTDGSPLLAHMNVEIAQHTPIQLHALYGSIDVTDALVINAGARTGSPELVAKLVADIQKKLDAQRDVSRYFDQLDVNADGGDVIVSVAINSGQLMALAMSGFVRAGGGDHPGRGRNLHHHHDDATTEP